MVFDNKKRSQSSRFLSFLKKKMHGVSFDQLSLRFLDEENEDRYVEAHYFQNLQHTRVSLLMAVFLFMLLGVLDYYLFPGSHWGMWAVRLCTMAPFTLFLVLLSYTKEWRIVQPAAAFAVLIAGITNIAIITSDAGYLGSVYFIGMVLFLLYGYTVLRLRYLWMVRAGLGMILFYEIIALFVARLDPEVFLINNVFLIAANISGMFASYVMEYFSRRDFIQNMLLAKSADGLALSLSERGSHLREFINRTKDAVLFQLRIDESGVAVEEVSPIIKEWLGLGKEEIKKIEHWFSGSEAGDLFIDKIQEISKRAASLDLELKKDFSDGRFSWFRFVTLAADDRRSKSTSVLGMILDITSEKEGARKQAKLIEQKNRFLNVLSHQFNTPLNVIKWATETLQGEELGALNQQQQALAIGMVQASDKMIAVLQDVVTGMAILEGGSVPIRRERLTAAEFILPVLNHFEIRLQKRKFKIIGARPERISLEGDVEKLQVAFSKILENAIDYSDDGDEIDIALEWKSKLLAIRIINQGIGLPSADLSRVFDLFYRGELAIRKQPNRSGVGLSLARFYVEAHGGTIAIKGIEKKVEVVVLLPTKD